MIEHARDDIPLLELMIADLRKVPDFYRDASALLVADRELRRVVEGLLGFGLAVVARLDSVGGGPAPARKAVAAHHVPRNRRPRGGHARLFIRGPGRSQHPAHRSVSCRTPLDRPVVRTEGGQNDRTV